MTENIFETPSSTPNFQTELAEQLAELAPEAVADGKIDVLKLQELLAQDAAETYERFGLFWPGKQRALRVAQMPTAATLRPEPEKSKDWGKTKNVFIEGDNLEVLKILQKHYHGKIKMIYIDPPYNTGKDFVYPDNFKEGLENYLEWTRQVNDAGKKISTNSETEGRFHSNWLNMMYPRLKLARNLLAQDGVMFISIDDNEIDNLTKICKEIFGEGNFSTTFIRQKKKKPSFLHNNVGSMTEYVVCVTKNSDFTFPFSVDTTTAGKKYPLNNAGNSIGRLTFPPQSVHFSMPDCVVEPQDMSEGNIRTRLLNKVEIFAGKNLNEFTLEGEWRYSQSKVDELLANGETITISKTPFRPNHVKAGGEVKKMHNLLTPQTYGTGTNEDGSEEIFKLMGGDFFDNPKPSSLIRVLVQAVTYDDPEATILDFFAGSGSTGHAVMDLNSQDGGSRNFILVQLPEPTPEDSSARMAGFATISEVTRERLMLVSQKLATHNQNQVFDSNPDADYGFRSYKLTNSSFQKWLVESDTDRTKLEDHLFSLKDSANDAASADELLTEILLKNGYSLSENVKTVLIGDLAWLSVSDGLVLAYLNEHEKPTLDNLREVAAREPLRLILLEDAFHGDDELKTNLAQLCKSKNIELWTA
jgi:adenine-specific DNA-methyltransferase